MVEQEIIIHDAMENLAGHGVQAVQPAAQALVSGSKAYAFCGMVKDCGHECKGVLGEPESECLPCMEDGCQNGLAVQPQDMMDMPELPQLTKKLSLINGLMTDMCGICHVTELGAKPCVALKCRHVYHAECLDGRIRDRKTRRITVAHLDCPVCKTVMGIDKIDEKFNSSDRDFKSFLQLFKTKMEQRDAAKQVVINIYQQSGMQHEATAEEGRDPFKFMMEKRTLYNCNVCKKIYNGGKNDFDGALRENMDAINFLCKPCSEEYLGYGKEFCDLHGNEFTDFKCQHCCSIALFVFENYTKFRCQPCFNDMMAKKPGHMDAKTQCTGGSDCALGVSNHPIATNKYALGCSLCRSEKLEVLVKETGSAGFNVETRGDMIAAHGGTNNLAELNRFTKGPGQTAPAQRQDIRQQPAHHADDRKKNCGGGKCAIF